MARGSHPGLPGRRTARCGVALGAALLLGCGGPEPGAEPSTSATTDLAAARPPPDLPPPAPPGAFALPGLSAQRPRPRLGWPVGSVHITSSFGWRVDPVSGRGVRLHRGVDFRGAIGDLVLSIGDGRIRFVGHDPLLGNLVIIDHGDGLQSLYGHLSDVLVVAEVNVARGAAIGLVGNTGRSAAPHLHLTVKLDGQAIDPLEVIGEPSYRPRALATPLERQGGSRVEATEREEPAAGPSAPRRGPPPEPPHGSPPHPLPHRSDDGGP